MTTPADRLAALAGVPPTIKTAPPLEPARPKKFPHGQHDISVIPYNASFDDAAERFLPWFWNKLKEDNLVEIYFPGQSKKGFADFVKLMSGDSVKVLLVVGKNADGDLDKAIGFATYSPVPFGSITSAMAGFIFFREFWDSHTTITAAQQIMDYWFKEAGLDQIIGLVAELNHPANRFLERLGWKKIGTIPMAHRYHDTQCASFMWQKLKAE